MQDVGLHYLPASLSATSCIPNSLRYTGCMIDRELIAATSASIVLSILHEADSYGYEIIQQVSSVSDGEIAWSEAMLYPVLHRLEERQYVRSYWLDSATGRKRKYYAITPSGKKALEEKRRQWSVVGRIFNVLWSSRSR